MDRSLPDHAVRAFSQQTALFALLKTGIPTAPPETAWRALTEAAARTLGVRRASIWFLAERDTQLVLADLFDLGTGQHAKGEVLSAERYPAYFHAMRWSRVVVAPDAATDPRTKEFAGHYLEAHGIVSMLDAGIWHEGKARGVLCLESVSARREWQSDEQQFAGSVADLAAATLVHTQLRAVEARLREVTLGAQADSNVERIAGALSLETGAAFFPALAEHLALALQAELVFIAENDPAVPHYLRTVAVHEAGAAASGFAFDVRNSPCALVLARGPLVVSKDAAARFPGDTVLSSRGIEAFVGVPLRNAHGVAFGVLAAFLRKAPEDTRLAENLLRVFAARAGAELERDHHLRALEHQAHHDALTGLPNRLLLKKIVEERIAHDGPGATGALLLVDLDRFKEINDTLGHPVGDQLLVAVGERLRESAAAQGGWVARLGGDEFAAWFPGMGDASEADRAARALLSALSKPAEVEGLRLEVGASVGIALLPRHASTPSGLLRCADVAMYAAKARGSGRGLYDASQDPYSTERLTLLSELGGAVRDGELRLAYQPRISIADGSVCGVEALVRWQHPRHGLLAPCRFVPLAELSDVVSALTRWVLDEALTQQATWRAKGHPMPVSVNFSARHLMDEGCADHIERLLAAHGTDPADLEIEITESALIADPERAAATLERVRALGVRIAVDDFGTGYSSLAHLRRLPLHTLKIDVSFVRHMRSSAADRAIVASTIHLAHDLGFAAVAEGIEDVETLAALTALGCDEGQGFHLGEPMWPPALEDWLAAQPAPGAVRH